MCIRYYSTYFKRNKAEVWRGRNTRARRLSTNARDRVVAVLTIAMLSIAVLLVAFTNIHYDPNDNVALARAQAVCRRVQPNTHTLLARLIQGPGTPWSQAVWFSVAQAAFLLPGAYQMVFSAMRLTHRAAGSALWGRLVGAGCIAAHALAAMTSVTYTLTGGGYGRHGGWPRWAGTRGAAQCLAA